MVRVFCDLKFEFLTLSRWFNESSLKGTRSTHICFSNIFKPFCWLIHDNLDALETTSIIELNKTELFLIPWAFSPPCYLNCFSNKFFPTCIQTRDTNTTSIWHCCHSFDRHIIISIQSTCVLKCSVNLRGRHWHLRSSSTPCWNSVGIYRKLCLWRHFC